jgi:RNA polymerase sigma factor (sigma-70 family)
MQQQSKSEIGKWVKEWRNGDAAAAKKLYEACNKASYNTILRIVSRHDIAQDLLQETFVLAFNRINDLKNDNHFPSWLNRIALNQALQYYRKHQSSREEEWDIEVHEEIETEEADFEGLNNIGIEKWLRIIDDLPPKSRLVFQLFYLEDLKHEDIAMRLNISLSTSKSQLRYAKSILKKTLSNNHVH